MKFYSLRQMMYYLRYGVWYTDEEILLYDRIDEINHELNKLRNKGWNINFLKRIKLLREKKQILDKLGKINNKQTKEVSEMF